MDLFSNFKSVRPAGFLIELVDVNIKLLVGHTG